tara:strand:+ start:470 stop:952 length:483 start_codon:yes stop_codon:yes gene_type:complete
MSNFPKNTGFSMPRGSKPEYSQLGSSNTTPKDGSGGIYYKSPVKETEEEKKKREEEKKKKEKETTTPDPTVETPEEEANIEDDEVEVKTDTRGQQIGKTFAAALAGGMDAVYGTKTEVPKVNPLAKEKVDKEVESEESENIADNIIKEDLSKKDDDKETT